MPPSNNPPNSPLYSSYSPLGIGSTWEPTPTVGSAHPAPTTSPGELVIVMWKCPISCEDIVEIPFHHHYHHTQWCIDDNLQMWLYIFGVHIHHIASV